VIAVVSSTGALVLIGWLIVIGCLIAAGVAAWRAAWVVTGLLLVVAIIAAALLL
jgi:hypothetical protein